PGGLDGLQICGVALTNAQSEVVVAERKVGCIEINRRELPPYSLVRLLPSSASGCASPCAGPKAARRVLARSRFPSYSPLRTGTITPNSRAGSPKPRGLGRI